MGAQDLRDLFRVVPEELKRSVTQAQLHALHAHQRTASPALTHHMAFMESLPAYAGENMLACLSSCTGTADTAVQSAPSSVGGRRLLEGGACAWAQG